MSTVSRLNKELDILNKQLSAGIITRYEHKRITFRIQKKIRAIAPKHRKKAIRRKPIKRKVHGRKIRVVKKRK
ncbi:hypothetical protein JW968_06325 [Candidatus Woesearchaeota archaeon]|nr:hypothetical protein [Candidatus Woesearchaeota archaeon]